MQAWGLFHKKDVDMLENKYRGEPLNLFQKLEILAMKECGLTTL